MKKIIVAVLAIALTASPTWSASNAQDEVFSDSVVFGSSGDTALVEFDSEQVKAWTLIPQGTAVHFTTVEGSNVNNSDILLLAGTTWGETNRSPKTMELRIMADDSAGTTYIRARGQ